jgi:hypothetical protein
MHKTIDKLDNQTSQQESSVVISGIDELLAGTLPPGQAAAMDALGFNDFVIGVRQHAGVRSSEAADEIVRTGMSNESRNRLYRNFQTFDSERIREYETAGTSEPALKLGWYNDSSLYRFVVVFPVPDDARETYAEDTSKKIDSIFSFYGEPENFFIEDKENNAGGVAINPEYIAGYVDETNSFHQNPEFMKGDEKNDRTTRALGFIGISQEE